MAGQVATRARRIFDELKGLALTLGLMLLAGTAIGQPFIVPSGSMEPTLMIGDEIAAAKYAYGYGRYSSPVGTIPLKGRILEQPPERGDIAVFALPRDPSQTYVKRLIGLPGDVVSERDGFVYINGAQLQEPYIKAGRRDHEPPRTWARIPKGYYFFMGDNRSASCDSRVWGPVPRANLIGEVFFVYWPPTRIGFR